MGVKKLVSNVDKLTEGFNQAFGDTLDLADETKRTDKLRQPKIGLFEGYNADVDSEEDMEEDDDMEVVDFW